MNERLNFHRRWRRKKKKRRYVSFFTSLCLSFCFIRSDIDEIHRKEMLMRTHKQNNKKENSTYVCTQVISLLLFNCSSLWRVPFFSLLFCLYLKTLCSMFIFTIELYTYAMGRIDRMSIHLNLSDQFELLPLCMSYQDKNEYQVARFSKEWRKKIVMSSSTPLVYRNVSLSEDTVKCVRVYDDNDEQWLTADKRSGMIISTEFLRENYFFGNEFESNHVFSYIKREKK